MFQRLGFSLFLSLWMVAEVQAASPWEGKWEMGRYERSFGGLLDIKNCKADTCGFEINATHGVNICNVEGNLKIKGNQAEYYRKERINGENFDEKILFDLVPDKRVIKVERVEGYFCGWNAFVDGTYEHESLPLRYPTSFDCWKSGLNRAETTICGSEKLSKADLEFDRNYKSKKNADWYQQRNRCSDDENCLWNFYKTSITQAFEREYQKTFNLYDYVQNQKLKWHSPTDLALLREFFITHLPDGYFGPWTSSLDDYCYDNSCEDCIAKFYTINGFYKVNESSFYMDKDQIWLAFVSANLEEPEDEAIIVFAPLGKNIEDIPPAIKTFTTNLSKSNLYAEGIRLKHFQTKPQWLYKLKSWFE